MKIKLVSILLLIVLVVNVNAGTLVQRSVSEIPSDVVQLSPPADYIAYKEQTVTTATKDLPVEKTPKNDIWLFDALSLVTRLVTCSESGVVGDAYSDSPSITADGKRVVFHSWASNFAAAPSCANVWMKDVTTGKINLIKDHALSPSTSADGRYVCYEYNADPEKGLPAIYRYDTITGEELLIDYTSLGNTKGGWYFSNPQISEDGMTILYHTTKNGMPEVWQWSEGKKPIKIRDGLVTE